MANTVDTDFEFPTELLVDPLVPIGVTGLDTLNNAVHRTVWEALNNSRRQERAPVLFKLLSPSHEFLQPKSKRQPYELYVPKGILKRSWMHKHLTLVPAVVVIFYDLDWDDPHWEERKLECTSRVQSIRVALEGRGSKVCVVLIQQKTALPSGEDLLAAERANSLIQAADLNTKSLFVLPNVDNINGFTARLEKALFEVGASYYSGEIRSIKSHREQLNKKTHQYLYVRHHFKIAFFSELKQDLSSAQMHYSESYSNLLEVRLSDTNEFEVKTIAGFIAYKMCRVLFLLSKPKDSISQFKAHIEHYRHKVGPALLLFQHYAWMSKQYSVFGDLFAEMIHKHNITASQTQHPGYYYQLAAKHAINRKQTAHHHCPGNIEYPTAVGASDDPLLGRESLEYFGQRPWRQCVLSAEPIDHEKERLGIQALQFIEKHKVNHSALVIGLYGNAISQFKTYRCPRMRRQLVVKMADEYYSSKDFGKALTLLTHMLWDYRVEGWTVIFDKLLSTALICAYLTASVSDYVSLCIEATARMPNFAASALENLLRVISGEVPKHLQLSVIENDTSSAVTQEILSSLPSSDIAAAEASWFTAKQHNNGPIVVDMTNVFSPIMCKASIEEAEYNYVSIKIYLRSELPDSIGLSKVAVTVSLASSTSEAICQYVGDQEPNVLSPRMLNVYETNVVPQPADVAKLVQVVSVLLTLSCPGSATPASREVILKFSGLPPDHTYPHPELIHFRVATGDVELEKFNKADWCIKRPVARRKAEVILAKIMNAPALLDEWYPVTLKLESKHSVVIQNVFITISLPGDQPESNIELKLCDSENSELVSLPVKLKVESIEAEKQSEHRLLIKSTTVGARVFNIQVTYEVDKDQCLTEESLEFETVPVFQVTTKLMNQRLQQLANVYSRQPFFVKTEITAVSPWPVTVQSTSYSLGDNIEFFEDYTCKLSGNCLSKDCTAESRALLITNKPCDKPTMLAKLHLSWTRKDGSVKGVNTMIVECMGSIEDTPVTVSISPPPCDDIKLPTAECVGIHPRVRSPMPLTYTLTNHTSLLLTFQLFMEASDSFMFSGHKQAVISVIPGGTRKLHYNMCPLVAGKVLLPKLTLLPLTPAISPQHMAHILDRMLPTTLFILPPLRKLENGENTNVPTIAV